MRRQGWRNLGLAGVLAGVGCVGGAPRATSAPVGLQLLRIEPVLRESRFSILSSFETEADAIFVRGLPEGAALDAGRAHGGARSLVTAPDTREIRIDLGALVYGRAFPGQWTLAGIWLYADQPARLAIERDADGRVGGRRMLEIPAGQWTAALVDIAGDDAAPPGFLVIRSADDRPLPRLWLDDALLVDNARTFVHDHPSASPSEPGWSIRQAGYTIRTRALPRFNLDLRTPEVSADGWELVEANAMRARYLSRGAARSLTVYVDGRAYWDGQYKPVGAIGLANDELDAQHRAPARLRVDEVLGKIDRATVGDANHDGYNECRGAYQLRANGPRLTVDLSPATGVLVNPILEVSGLPEGKVRLTVEGKLIESVLRLEDGGVLAEIPAHLTRPTTAEFRVNAQ